MWEHGPRPLGQLSVRRVKFAQRDRWPRWLVPCRRQPVLLAKPVRGRRLETSYAITALLAHTRLSLALVPARSVSLAPPDNGL